MQSLSPQRFQPDRSSCGTEADPSIRPQIVTQGEGVLHANPKTVLQPVTPGACRHGSRSGSAIGALHHHHPGLYTLQHRSAEEQYRGHCCLYRRNPPEFGNGCAVRCARYEFSSLFEQLADGASQSNCRQPGRPYAKIVVLLKGTRWFHTPKHRMRSDLCFCLQKRLSNHQRRDSDP